MNISQHCWRLKTERMLCCIMLRCWACTKLIETVQGSLMLCDVILFDAFGCPVSFRFVVHRPRTGQTLGTCWMNGSANWFDNWIYTIRRTGKSVQTPTLNWFTSWVIDLNTARRGVHVLQHSQHLGRTTQNSCTVPPCLSTQTKKNWLL